MTDHALRRRLARAGLEECRRVYSWDSVGRRIQDVYAEVVRAGAQTCGSMPPYP